MSDVYKVQKMLRRANEGHEIEAPDQRVQQLMEMFESIDSTELPLIVPPQLDVVRWTLRHSTSLELSTEVVTLVTSLPATDPPLLGRLDRCIALQLRRNCPQ